MCLQYNIFNFQFRFPTAALEIEEWIFEYYVRSLYQKQTKCQVIS
jgi:hypothetical protein